MLRNVEEVKAVLELAAEVDMALPKVKAQDAKAMWPDICLTASEIKAIRFMTREGKPDFSPSDEQKRIWEIVTTEWIKAFQDSPRHRQQWIIIWLKSCGCQVKTILRYVGFQKTKLYKEYELGMVLLLNYLQVKYTKEDLDNIEPYKPELILPYPKGKVTGTTLINILKEWLAEVESENIT